jgi:hypothetical protein
LRGKPHKALVEAPGAAGRVLLAAALLALAWAPAPTRAAGDDPGEPAPAAETLPPAAETLPPAVEPGPGPPVSLDRLLELPQGFELRPAEQRAGRGETEWRRLFGEARKQIEDSRAALERSKAELAELAGSSDAWTVAPPVGAAVSNEAPLSYSLRQRINREEAALKDAERKLVDLDVEANLADVPDQWRR